MYRSYLFLTLYAFLVMVLGIYGYQQASSLPSLLAGGISGALLLVFAFFLYKRKAWAFWAALMILLFLLFFFMVRFYRSFGFFPAFMTLLTLLQIFSIFPREFFRKNR